MIDRVGHELRCGAQIRTHAVPFQYRFPGELTGSGLKVALRRRIASASIRPMDQHSVRWFPGTEWQAAPIQRASGGPRVQSIGRQHVDGRQRNTFRRVNCPVIGH